MIDAAPNNRVIMMAPDMVLLNDDELQAGAQHYSLRRLPCKLRVAPGMKGGEYLDGTELGEGNCKFLGSSFEDASSIVEGHFTLDAAQLRRFSGLCSSNIWKRAIEASSPALVGFCTSVLRGLRL
jgi:hypothetical protein